MFYTRDAYLFIITIKFNIQRLLLHSILTAKEIVVYKTLKQNDNIIQTKNKKGFETSKKKRRRQTFWKETALLLISSAS